jgi:site-specific recombinase XerD
MNKILTTTLQKIIKHIDSPYVLCNEDGERYKSVKKAFNNAVRRAGIKDFHFHDLRHTFPSNLVMAGVDIKTVQELMGHKTIAMTLRYSHLSLSHKQSAVDKLERCIDGLEANLADAVTTYKQHK